MFYKQMKIAQLTIHITFSYIYLKLKLIKSYQIQNISLEILSKLVILPTKKEILAKVEHENITRSNFVSQKAIKIYVFW